VASEAGDRAGRGEGLTVAATKVSRGFAGGQRAREGGRPPKHTIVQIAAALRACGGNCSRASKKLGIHPETLRRRMEKNQQLVDVCDEAGEQLLDDAEDAIVRMVRDSKHRGHAQAVIAVLKLRGKSRGWETHSTVDATLGATDQRVLILPAKDPLPGDPGEG
jgi:hypothetical protein